jgi:uncharacterized protein (TIGR03437 family)
MNRMARVFVPVIFALTQGTVHAQLIGPFISNNYNFVQPGLPGYGIAQGSIFVVAGAPVSMTSSTALQDVPLARTLAGVSVTVTVGNVTTQAIPYYVSPAQITAILPSNTPLGTATVTVTSGGQSVSGMTTVVPSGFGLATQLPPQGVTAPWVGALAQDDSEGGQLLNQTNAANPGEYLTLWGTGLGAVSGDETEYQTPMNLLNIPVEVTIGGQDATVTYRGRSIYPGLDQINIIVPAGLSGCNVSVVVTASGVPSNFATIPVAASGRACSDPGLTPLSPSGYQALLGMSSVNIGGVALTAISTTATSGSGPMTTGSAYAMFYNYSAQQLATSGFLQAPSFGSCIVTHSGWLPPIATPSGLKQLDAGAEVTVTGPGGTLVLPKSASTGGYVDTSGSASLLQSEWFLPDAGGALSLGNGSGGADIGAFTASLTENLTTPVSWTNQGSIDRIDRTKALLLTWSGGAPGSFVYIVGSSAISVAAPTAGGETINVQFICTAPVTAGQFTVPSPALESLPPTSGGTLSVASASIQEFSAPNLNLGLLLFGIGSGTLVAFN